MQKGKLILIMGPSGSGKGTLISMLKERRKDFIYPISATTRQPREGEKDGETYHFLSKSDFENNIKAGNFLEYALVHSQNYYGLLKKPVMDAINSGNIVIREIDVQGFDSITKELDKEFYASIFILPPSEDILIRRIKERAAISDSELENRLESLKKEMKYADLADFTVQNIDYGQEKMYEDLVKKIDLIVET